jgi:hypothetical protein
VFCSSHSPKNKRDESSAGGSSSERDVDEDSDTLNFSEVCEDIVRLFPS